MLMQPQAGPMQMNNNLAARVNLAGAPGAPGAPTMAPTATPLQAPMAMQPQPGAIQARPGFVPGQIPNVNAPGMPQPGGFAQSPMVQNFLRQRMMGMGAGMMA